MGNIQLIPYKVQALVRQTTEIPQGVQFVEAPELWENGASGDGVIVAVIDTGCDVNHPDFESQIIGGYNFTTDYDGDVDNFSDNNGHGTHVCGTIAAIENNQGVVGVAPKVKLLVLKVLTESGEGTLEAVTEAIDYAINWRGPNQEEVRIMSMSLGSSVDDPVLHETIKRAVAQNILVVCAAGNAGDGEYTSDEYEYPGSYPEVVQVGSVNLQGEISDFSNSNLEVDLVAPGEGILSTYLNGEYAKLSGTSMATPHVSGAAALLLEQYERTSGKKMTESELYGTLIKRTVPIDSSRNEQGNGVLKLFSSTMKRTTV
ncbi:S8 family peptidase [Bacillus songklensis]|uniref:S8 family peptidase n=1 Tax=Bacillus songklensis TaxID=1069116 RepID=A0ABV8B644_9BACI